MSGAWTKVRDYVWLDGRPLAQIEYPGPTGSTQGYVYYFHLDHIGLPRYLTNQAGQTVWSATARPYGDITETTTTDPLSGRVVVTNLRLPGQYDERLLGSLGLQGPYYNWNRWYLPGVGRYLELDPRALKGKFNAPYRPDWYNYALGNPLRFADPDGRRGVPPGVGTGTGTGVLGVLGGVIGLLWPSWTGGDPCENSPEGCVRPPPQCPPTNTKPCQCTCLGSADPDWNPEDTEHGNRDVGQQDYPTACEDECKMRGFSNSQCI